MRHQKKFNHLGRKKGHRRAMLANMANSLIEHKRISTTLAKAKALRLYIDPIITRSKEDSTHSRRVVFGYLQNKETLKELYRTVSPKIASRPGGYTRILRTGNRLGDNAEMCFIELVDFNETYTQSKEAATTKKKRSRRGGATAKETTENPQAAKSTAEAPVKGKSAPKEAKLEEVKQPEAKKVEVSSENKKEGAVESPKDNTEKESKSDSKISDDKKNEEG